MSTFIAFVVSDFSWLLCRWWIGDVGAFSIRNISFDRDDPVFMDESDIK
jgi:hypothetical protein